MIMTLTRRSLCAALLCIPGLLLTPAVVAAQSAKPAPDKKVVYKTLESGDLSLHVFNPPGHDQSKAVPAIVFFFGGGWNGGSPSQFYGQSRAIADAGMVAMCAEYRVKSRNGTSPKECVSDGKSAIRWVRSHAKNLGIDPDRIAAGGGSAGGHVAAATAMVDHFDDPKDDQSVSPRPAALILFNPVFDNGPEGYGFDRVKEYWKKISPLHNLDADSPPTIFFLGTKDKLIPVSTGKAYQEKMQSLKRRCDMHLYQDASHGFFNKGEPYQDTLAKSLAFLKSLGYIE